MGLCASKYKQARAGAAGFPEAADVALFLGVVVAPTIFAFVLHNKEAAIG